MMKRSVIAAVLLTLASPVAMAQTPPATAPAVAAKPAAPKPAITPVSERTPESLKCSADADAAKLKGAERKKFRAKCMKDAKKAAAAPAVTPAAKKN